MQAFYGVRSERQIMERLEYDLLFRWFVGLVVDDAAWDPTTFGKNHDRLLAGDVANRSSPPSWPIPRSSGCCPPHTQRRRRADRSLGFHDELPAQGPIGRAAGARAQRRARLPWRAPSNATHQSTTDPDARLYRKGAGREARLRFMGHALMEN